MPSYLKALVVVLVLATAVFTVARFPVCASGTTLADFRRRRNCWFAITLTAFLAHNFWAYIIVASALLLLVAQLERNKIAMYFALLFAVPMISGQIPGFGIVHQLFVIDYGRVLSLTVLLPAFVILRRQSDTEPFGQSIYDKILAGYLVLQFLLILSINTFTNTLRIGVFYAFIDVFLPYYVGSRLLRDLDRFRDALMAFVLAAVVIGVIAVFEISKHWLLYASLDDVLGHAWGYGHYLEREAGLLRAQASIGHPIPLGFVMAVALGFFLFVRRSIPNAAYRGLGLLVLLGGLIAPVSRGSWVGAAAMVLVFVATSPRAGRRVVVFTLAGVVVASILAATPVGEKVMQFLPFVGTVQAQNVVYRQRLLEIGIEVILQHPFFGAFSYIYSPAFLELRQGGGGFIDIVNTYVAIGLSSGLVGLSLFFSFFAFVTGHVFRGMRSLTDRESELYLLGQVLFATLTGILLILFTTSSITVIPLIYWSVAGLGVSYVRMLSLAEARGRSQSQEDRLRGRARHSRSAPLIG